MASEPATDTLSISAQAQARIDFKVNLTNFDKTYHSNDSALGQVLARIDSMVLDPRMRVERITVVGTASPEGPYLNNVRLANGRARAFISILRERYSFPDSIYAISTIPEDWDGMRMMLAADSTIPYGAVVLSFLDRTANIDGDTRERRLKSLDGGAPYASMRHHVLPYLRRASVLVDYDTRWLCCRIDNPAPAYTDIRPLTSTPSFSLMAVDIPEHAAMRQRFFALKTNLLWDAALCANLGFELELWPHWSLDVPVWYSPYDIHPPAGHTARAALLAPRCRCRALFRRAHLGDRLQRELRRRLPLSGSQPRSLRPGHRLRLRLPPRQGAPLEHGSANRRRLHLLQMDKIPQHRPQRRRGVAWRRHILGAHPRRTCHFL
ncbi:MAG: DUF3575 domain-containing protein [Muribaculaceae bacterium]|nr:DUF3575 domain-containing protein [Muribaculaceae bacterium]